MKYPKPLSLKKNSLLPKLDSSKRKSQGQMEDGHLGECGWVWAAEASPEELTSAQDVASKMSPFHPSLIFTSLSCAISLISHGTSQRGRFYLSSIPQPRTSWISWQLLATLTVLVQLYWPWRGQMSKGEPWPARSLRFASTWKKQELSNNVPFAHPGIKWVCFKFSVLEKIRLVTENIHRVIPNIQSWNLGEYFPSQAFHLRMSFSCLASVYRLWIQGTRWLCFLIKSYCWAKPNHLFAHAS